MNPVKKIVVDGRMLGWTGVGRYSAELLKNLETIDRHNQYLVLRQDADKQAWEPSASNFTVVPCNIPPYSVGEQIKLPGIISRLKPDLVHFLAPNSPIAYRGNKVTTVHDFTLVDYQNVRGNWLLYQIKFWLFRLVISLAVRTSTYIIADNNYIASQVQRRYGRKNHVKSIYLGPASFKPSNSSSAAIQQPYLLYVGNAYPYKNLNFLLEAFAKIRQKRPELNLVLVGPNDSFYRALRRQAGQGVFFTGRVGDDELASLYQHASLYVFPSLSEGFGLPGLEAMSMGLPVLAANASCLPEVYGGAAVYFDPQDAGDLASKINDLLSHPKKLDEMRQAGYEQIKKYSWEQMAAQTLEVYENASTDIR